MIDALNFSPYPKNPMIAKFFREIGLADELGSGVKNVTQYLKVYSGGVPEFIEADIFKQVLPINLDGCTTTQDNTQDNTQDVTQDKYAQRILAFCEKPRSRAEIMEYIGIKERAYFKKSILDPLLDGGQLLMMLPDKPTSRNQKYVAKK